MYLYTSHFFATRRQYWTGLVSQKNRGFLEGADLPLEFLAQERSRMTTEGCSQMSIDTQRRGYRRPLSQDKLLAPAGGARTSPTARVMVLEPSPSDFLVLFVNFQLDVGDSLRQPDGGGHPRYACSNAKNLDFWAVIDTPVRKRERASHR